MEVKKETKKKELLYDGVFYDVTEWIKKHPGGNVMELYITTGEDSIHAVQQYHHRSTPRVMSIMKSLPHREATEKDAIFTPEVMERNSALTKDFLKLYDELKSEGLFDADPWHIVKRLGDIFGLFAVGTYLFINHANNPLLWMSGIFLTSLSAGRGAWVGHEAGHHSFTGFPKLDRFLHKFIFGFFLGLSACYWRSQHTRHHSMPQNVKYDIDLRTLPLMAFNKKVPKTPEEGKTFLVQHQAWLYPINTLVVFIAWKWFLHPLYAIRKGHVVDLFFMTLHSTLLLSTGVTNFILVTWLSASYTILQSNMAHTHLPYTEDPKHWVEYSLTHTNNVRSSWWVDYWMGYVNYQTEHHLFPAMPHFKIKKCSGRVKDLAKKHDLPYNLYPYHQVVAKTLKNMFTVSKELAVL